MVWLGPRTLAVGIGYRSNTEGAAQLRRLLGHSIDELIEVPLPHWRGPGDVLHLMSLLSPVDRDLAVVYSPLMAVPFRQRLAALGIAFVEVPDEEFDSMGVNVLALAPRRCVMLAGNPRTRRALEQAGASVLEYRRQRDQRERLRRPDVPDTAASTRSSLAGGGRKFRIQNSEFRNRTAVVAHRADLTSEVLCRPRSILV